MKRGEIWTVSATGYAGKPRPAVIVQGDEFARSDSVTICPLTSDPTLAPMIRIPIDPSDANGLRSRSQLMVDKITTVRRSNLGRRVGRLAAPDVRAMNRAILVFLGLG